MTASNEAAAFYKSADEESIAAREVPQTVQSAATNRRMKSQ